MGRLGGYFLETLDDDVRARFEEALSRLKDAGAAIVDVELRRLPDIAATYVNVALPEAFACHSDALKRAPEEFGRNVRERLEMGGRISRDAYIKAQSDRAQMRTAVDRALSDCDVLVLPTMPIPPQPVGAATVVVDSIEQPLRPLTLRLTQLFNLTGHPAISIPCGETRGWIAVRDSIGWPPQTDARAAAGVSQLRSVRDSTCTFIFLAPVSTDSTRLTRLMMSAPTKASQNPPT